MAKGIKVTVELNPEEYKRLVELKVAFLPLEKLTNEDVIKMLIMHPKAIDMLKEMLGHEQQV